MSGRRILYLPVEMKARELLGRGFLAARAVERGWIVVMGSGIEVRKYMLDHPSGLFVIASVPELKAERLAHMRQAGHRIANLCEESVVYASERYYCDRKLSPKCLPFVDCLLVVGSGNAEHIRTYRPEHAHKIAVTGNPRFDITLPELRSVYEAEARKLSEKYGRFILVNTNFGRNNPFEKSDPVPQMMRNGLVSGAEQAAYVYRSIDYKNRQMSGIMRLLGELVSSGTIPRIVVRPHPVEDHAVWREWAAPLGIEVRYEGDANVWMLAAEAVLHPGCTTGVEGLLLDRPVFSYVPEPGIEFLNQSDEVSEHVNGSQEFSSGLSGVRGLDQAGVRRRFAKQRDRLGFYIANMQRPFAADRILDELEQLDLPTVTVRQIGLEGRGILNRLTHAVFASQRDLQVRPNARQLQKFSALSARDVQSPVSHWIEFGLSSAATDAHVAQLSSHGDALVLPNLGDGPGERRKAFVSGASHPIECSLRPNSW